MSLLLPRWGERGPLGSQHGGPPKDEGASAQFSPPPQAQLALRTRGYESVLFTRVL